MEELFNYFNTEMCKNCKGTCKAGCITMRSGDCNVIKCSEYVRKDTPVKYIKPLYRSARQETPVMRG